ncbi:MAG: hypothetical protein RR365_11310, partial [Bacteroides sp.]
MCSAKLLSSFINKGECIEVNATNITVDGFKNVMHNSLDLEKVTALLSLNGYGKSNVLEAIDFGFDFITSGSKTKSKLMAASKCMPRLCAVQSRDYSFSLSFTMSRNSKEYSVDYGYSFSWKTKAVDSRITTEFLRVKLNEKGQKFNSYIDRNTTKALYKKSETARCTNVIKISDNDLAINKLLADDDLFYQDIVKSINEFGFYVVKHLDASNSYNPDPIIWKYYSDNDLEGIHSIPKTVYMLKEKDSDKYELLINSFLQLFPNFESVAVKSFEISAEKQEIFVSDGGETDEFPPFDIDDAVYLMNVKDKNLTSPIRFENLSDGAKRV